MAQFTDRDTAGVVVPPPLIYLSGLVSGLALQTVFNAPRLPAAMRRLGLPCIGVGGLIIGLAVPELRRADTELNPRKPTTAIVSSGSNTRSRNPVYLGLSAIYVDLSLLARATTALFSGFGDEAPGNRMPDQHNVWLRSGRHRVSARMSSSAWTMPVGSAKLCGGHAFTPYLVRDQRDIAVRKSV